MERINTPTSVNGKFVNSFGSRKATQLSAEWCNGIQESIAKVIEAAGITLSADDLQLLTAVKSLAHVIDDGIPLSISQQGSSGSTVVSKAGIAIANTGIQIALNSSSGGLSITSSDLAAVVAATGISISGNESVPEGEINPSPDTIATQITKEGIVVRKTGDASGNYAVVARNGMSLFGSDGSLKVFAGYDPVRGGWYHYVSGNAKIEGQLESGSVKSIGLVETGSVKNNGPDDRAVLEYFFPQGYEGMLVNVAGPSIIVFTDGPDDDASQMAAIFSVECGVANVGRKLTVCNNRSLAFSVKYGPEDGESLMIAKGKAKTFVLVSKTTESYTWLPVG